MKKSAKNASAAGYRQAQKKHQIKSKKPLTGLAPSAILFQ
jgi:hypothetical protein